MQTITKKIASRKAVSDIISTLLLVSITAVGGTLVFVTISSDPSIQNIDPAGIVPSGETKAEVIITAYDSRDGTGLSGIGSLDNDDPSNDGLETDDYIVLHIRNTGNDVIVLDDINLNRVSHRWDSTQGTLSGSLPATGTFVIIEDPNDADPTIGDFTVSTSQQIQAGRDVRIVLKLASDFTGSDIIQLNRAVNVDIGIVNFDINEFIITSGDTT